ncbi:hypothetical protein Taro_002963 [Colocasia esculenta]|uniref:WLM domain-containing protein n=1 Tax=Colocasia esculenta TaxID=4460 RepID=A0A843TQE9_COLES|nr:hypothetical protein [Colocasia esculenta]
METPSPDIMADVSGRVSVIGAARPATLHPPLGSSGIFSPAPPRSHPKAESRSLRNLPLRAAGSKSNGGCSGRRDWGKSIYNFCARVSSRFVQRTAGTTLPGNRRPFISSIPILSLHKMENESSITVVVIWRDKHIKVEMDENSSVIEFGQELQNLTKVKAETMRLLVPQSASKGSKLITPFSDEYSSLALREISIVDGKTIRMMGVFEYEIEEVSQSSMKPDLRIRGFDEEEERLRQRLLNTPGSSLKLPQGPYIFCDFCTLHIPGIELNPPPSEALRRMHMLACDPGIIAIMNKHRWRVGIMTELAPVGYVGISPKCVLGFNKNCGEEISLRLRTDDLKGFRKYESIKKTLLHELLNQEAASLDWTRSASRTLSGHKITDDYENVLHASSSSQKSFHKLGGGNSSLSINARESSVAAAYRRILNSASSGLEEQMKVEDVKTGRLTGNILDIPNEEHISNVAAEPDPVDSWMGAPKDNVLMLSIDDVQVDAMKVNCKHQSVFPVPEGFKEPDPDDGLHNGHIFEPDPYDGLNNQLTFEPDPHDGLNNGLTFEPDPDDSLVGRNVNPHGEREPDNCYCSSVGRSREEPDPDDSEVYKIGPGQGEIPRDMENVSSETQMTYLQNEMRDMEPDPDDSEVKSISVELNDSMECNPDDLAKRDSTSVERETDDCTDELNNEELHRIEEPVAVMCKRLQKAIEMLRSEAPPVEATSSLQTLVKIIRNVIDHPDETKFRRLRKANLLFQRNIANFKAAMEVLTVIGFCEDVVADEFGRMETYLVLRRNDPGLLWLAKSSLEVSIS